MNVYLTRSLAFEAFQFQRKQYVVCFVLFCCSLSPFSTAPSRPSTTHIQHVLVYVFSLLQLPTLATNPLRSSPSTNTPHLSETEEMKISSHSTLNRTWNKFPTLLLNPSSPLEENYFLTHSMQFVAVADSLPVPIRCQQFVISSLNRNFSRFASDCCAWCGIV